MKIKLLKKIRKQYSIKYYPEGVYKFGYFFKGPLMFLEDNKNEYRFKVSSLEKNEGYDELYSHLISWIQEDYGPSKSEIRMRTKPSEQLWYKK